MELLGRHHPLLRRIRTLRRDRGERDRQRLFLAEGLHLAEEALAHGASIRQALVAEDFERRPGADALLRELQRAAVPVSAVTARVMQSLQDARAPQGITLLIERMADSPDTHVPRIAVVADGVQEPGNLGALLRTARAAGADAFFVLDHTVDPYHPRAVRASQGAVFGLQPRRTNHSALASRVGRWGLRTLALDPRAGRPYDRCDLTLPCALYFGSEGAGLTPEVTRAAAESVRIPMSPGVESLSVVAAAAIILFEIARRQRLANGAAQPE